MNYIDNFLLYLKNIKNKSDGTIKNYKSDLKMFHDFICKSKNITALDRQTLDNISLSDLYSFIGYLKENRKNGTNARARKIASLKSFFKYLKKIDAINNNPTLDLETPKIEKKNPVYLTLEESKRLLKSIRGTNKERDLCIITLFLNCGLRLSELCNINISQIKEDTLTVFGKGAKERTIYLNKKCLKALEKYLKIRDTNYKIKDQYKDALFISRNGNRISKNSVENLLKKHIENAGLDSTKYTPHKLRHSYATLMHKYGNVDIRVLQKLMGHESIATTQIYTSVDNEQLRKASKNNPLNKQIRIRREYI